MQHAQLPRGEPLFPEIRVDEADVIGQLLLSIADSGKELSAPDQALLATYLMRQGVIERESAFIPQLFPQLYQYQHQLGEQ
jgi:hypothetical protein